MAEMAVREFIGRLQSLMPFQDDGFHFDAPAIVRLVAEAPQVAARVIAESLRVAANDQRVLRIAEVVAVAYRFAHSDDTLECEVAARCEELGRSPALVRFELDGANPSVTLLEFFEAAIRSKEEEAVIPISVSSSELNALDIYPYITSFSPNGLSAEGLKQLRSRRGRCSLTFMVGDDDREVVLIPQVRQFVRKLHDALPFFPYYLDPDPESAMLPMYIGCLVDPAAVQPCQGGGWSIDVTHHTVEAIMLDVGRHVIALAEQLDDDPEPICRQLLSLLSGNTDI